MVFSSMPAYLDPSLWQQQHHHHLQNQQLQEHQQQQQQQHHHQLNHTTGAAQAAAGSNTFANPLLLTPPSLPLQQTVQNSEPCHAVSSASILRPPPTSSIRPGSMSERARMANIPPPGRALNCPRCHSTDTKFCYYNNYSLSQPRHFCKTCRRYWTHGGAMRNVPVGGCRRNNKRSSSGSNNKASGSTSSNSKSSSATSDLSTGSTSSAAIAASSSFSGGGTISRMADILGINIPPTIPSTLRFMTMAPLHHHFASDQFGLGSAGLGAAELGLTGYVGMSTPMPINAAAGPTSGLQVQLGSNMVGGAEHWRMQQPPTPTSFPLFGGMDGSTATNMYAFEGGAGGHMDLSRFGVASRPNAMSLDSRELGPGADEVVENKLEEISHGRHRHPAHHHHGQQHEMDMSLTRRFHLGMNELGGAGGGDGHQYSWDDGNGSGTPGGGVSTDAWTSSSTVVHTINAAATDISGLNSSSSTTGPM